LTSTCTATPTITPTCTCEYGGSYDAHAIGVYEFENNGNDISGNGYDLAKVNLGGYYSPTSYRYGSFSYYNDPSANNYDRFPAALENRLAGLGSFTIEFQVFVPNKTLGTHSLIPVTRGGAAGLANNLLLQIKDSTDWDPWNGAWGDFQVGTVGIYITSPPYPASGWHHFSIGWTGARYNLYMDGTVIGHIDSTVNIFTSSSGGTFGLASWFGNTYGGNYGMPSNSGLDRLILSDIDRGGVETGYSSCNGEQQLVSLALNSADKAKIKIKPVADSISAANTYNFPNPASSMTTIRFSMNEPERAQVYIYSMGGKMVWQAVVDSVEGVNALDWDLKNQTGNPVANGVYLFKVITKNKIITKKMAVIK
jgi:hypothetical protein